MSRIFYILFGFLLLSCKKEIKNIQNLNGNKISIFGHGGMGIGHPYPMNSLESISYSLNLESDGTEIDIQMTADSVLVLYHDLELSDQSNLSGQIHQKKWSEISGGKYTNPPYGSYQIITLDQLLASNKLSKTLLFDCKILNPDTSKVYQKTFSKALIKLIDQYQIQDQVIISLKSVEIIKTLKELRPDLRIIFYTNYEYGLENAVKYNLDGIMLSVKDISKEQVQIAHSNNLKVYVFNTHSNKRNIEAIYKNVDFILTDKLKHLIRVLK